MAQLNRLYAIVWLLFTQNVLSIEVNWNSTDSIKSAASVMAYDLVSYYQGNQSGFIPGLLGQPYYWWEAGAMFGSLINYWHYTGDATYNEITMQAMQFQVGKYQDYNPENQSSSMGNDDQAFWAITALQAVEYNFPNPAPGQPSWLALVQAVFNEQVGRWDDLTCGGGLRWQVYQRNGYHLKNTISNGCLFTIAARLARYTGDDMYAQWAIKVWDWMWRTGLIDETTYDVYDNSDATNYNCTRLDRHTWSYNSGVLLMGTSTMFNITNGDPYWRNHTSNLLKRAEFNFFNNGTMSELCELHQVCNVDQKSFKAYLSRWLAASTQLAPFITDTVTRLLSTSARSAARQCTGGAKGTLCGTKWFEDGKWDGTDGVGQQMSALECTLGTLVQKEGVVIQPPVTGTTGGTSAGNPTAGRNSTNGEPGTYIEPPKRGDKIGAWFLTAFIVLASLFSIWFMWSTAFEPMPVGKRSGMGEKAAVVLDLKGKGVDRRSLATAGVLEPIGEEEKGVPKYLGGDMAT